MMYMFLSNNPWSGDINLLNLFCQILKQVGGKEIKCEACRAFYLFFTTHLINLTLQKHEC